MKRDIIVKNINLWVTFTVSLSKGEAKSVNDILPEFTKEKDFRFGRKIVKGWVMAFLLDRGGHGPYNASQFAKRR